MTTRINVELTADPLVPADRLRQWEAQLEVASGARCSFAGCTRAESDPVNGVLQNLTYEAYEPMAVAQMQALADEAARRWPLHAILLIHRTGHVGLGEASVLIAVAGGHRDEVFAACRHLIDTLKQQVPIWKQECWSSGATRWSDPLRADAPATGASRSGETT